MARITDMSDESSWPEKPVESAVTI